MVLVPNRYKLEKKGKTFKKPATSSNDLNFKDA